MKKLDNYSGLFHEVVITDLNQEQKNIIENIFPNTIILDSEPDIEYVFCMDVYKYDKINNRIDICPDQELPEYVLDVLLQEHRGKLRLCSQLSYVINRYKK